MTDLDSRFGLPLNEEQNQRVAREVAEIEAIEITPEIEAKYDGRFENMSEEHRITRIKTIEHNDRRRQADEAERIAARKAEERESLERSMGGIAASFVEIFVTEDDQRDRDELREQVLQALQPLHTRLVRAEWDGVIR